MVERKPLPDLHDVPHLELERMSSERAEFSFRGAKGHMHRCDLGLCMALAFPRRVEGVDLAHKISLLLASQEQTFDFGLQYDGVHWLLWRRHDVGALSSEGCQHALDELLSVMRFLYSRFVGRAPKHKGLYKSSVGRFA